MDGLDYVIQDLGGTQWGGPLHEDVVFGVARAHVEAHNQKMTIYKLDRQNFRDGGKPRRAIVAMLYPFSDPR